MLRNKTRLAWVVLLVLAVVALGALIAFSLRAPKQAPPSPTVNIPQVQTQAVLAFSEGLTSTAQAKPTGTKTSTPAPSTQEAASTASTSSVSATPSCFGLRFVKDVTIPDNTRMTPAQVFTKTWLVENSGTCPWEPGFQVVLIGGVAMGGSPFRLAQTVGPGGRVQISIKMAAPTNQTGTVQGTWSMTDLTGEKFGEPMWVTIDVGTGTQAPPTVTATGTP